MVRKAEGKTEQTLLVCEKQSLPGADEKPSATPAAGSSHCCQGAAKNAPRSERRAWDSNPQPLSGHDISSVAASHSLTLQTRARRQFLERKAPLCDNRVASCSKNPSNPRCEYTQRPRLIDPGFRLVPGERPVGQGPPPPPRSSHSRKRLRRPLAACLNAGVTSVRAATFPAPSISPDSATASLQRPAPLCTASRGCTLHRSILRPHTDTQVARE